MGHNVDLIRMIGAPETLQCPNCKGSTKTDFDEYDIDCGDPNVEDGLWKCHVYCEKCEHEFNWKKTIKVTPPYSNKCKECGEDKPVGNYTGECLECLDWKRKGNDK